MSISLRRQIRFIDELVIRLLDERALLMDEMQGGGDGKPAPRNPKLAKLKDDELRKQMKESQEALAAIRKANDMTKEGGKERMYAARKASEFASEAHFRAYEIGKKAGVFK